MQKFVYNFDEGNKDMKSILGGKGANLAEMKKIGLPVPNGFTISTAACNNYFENNKNISNEIINQIDKCLKDLEESSKKQLGGENPLLVSVRSGSVISMPGMMDTILNLGLNDKTVEILGKNSTYEFAYDAYRRLIQMFSDVVLGIEKYNFDRVYNKYEKHDLESLKKIVAEYKIIVKKEVNRDFPQDPKEQLMLAINAVFDSWNNSRAIIYRKLNNISDSLGTAVNIQEMVFGNLGETSGTGVAFTRNPSTGENRVFGEYLLDAQGEDVVAGIRTPKDISTLKDTLPEVYEQFMNVTKTLENHYKNMQDIEFTVENKKLFILQTRNGKRTAEAAITIATDMESEGLISKEEALMMIEPNVIHQLLHPSFSAEDLEKNTPIAKGLPASPGAGSGEIYFNSEDVLKAKENGKSAVLVRTETSPEDIEGMVNADAVLTSRGGMTSHAAVVARGMGKCCVAGCNEMTVNEELEIMTVNNKTYKKGDIISIDGKTGNIYEGLIKKEDAKLSEKFNKVNSWANEVKKMAIRTNSDTVKDTKVALEFGAEGIGLCRTEHMFFESKRIIDVRSFVLAENDREREEAVLRLLPHQKKDFYEIFELINGLPINIRLLDPPLHEFLPHTEEDIKQLSELVNKDVDYIKDIINNVKEVNPMLGHRGCRLGISYEMLYKMQTRAIFEAICELDKVGIKSNPEIMIPLVGFETELKELRTLVIETADEILRKENVKCDYTVGTMIEVPRAALTADEIARQADFFSFGTNDLTQMTLGFSRDDSGKFIGEYIDKKIFERDPFQTIDINGVGKLIKIACELGRKTKPNLKIGICGEHGGEENSIEFLNSLNLSYVSCSPFRVPVARIAAARAEIKRRENEN